MQAPDFRALFESSPGLYLALLPDSPRFTIVAVSDAYARATMTRREQILGRALFEVFPDNPDDPQASGERNLRESLERVIATHAPDAMAIQKYDVRRPPELGGGFEERWWSPVNSPVPATDGSLDYIVHRVEDVTDFVLLKQRGVERDKLTDELRLRAEAMEAEVFLRAHEIQLANEQLRQANAEVSRLYERTLELDRLKTQFFANVSHELRTPLTLIVGPVQRLLAGAAEPRVRGELEVIERNARTLLRHVNDLLDVASLDEQSLAPCYAKADLAAVVRMVAEHFDSLAQELGIRWEVQAPGELSMETDVDMVRRVLLNLLSNAFKFTPAGGHVRITLRHADGQATIEVGDSGPGIPPEMREAVFERFRQLEGGTQRRHGGTGLGLAIAREFVLLLGGRIEVNEAPEGGALFVVQLPLQAPRGAKVAKGPTREAPGDVVAQVQALRKAEVVPPAAASHGAPLVLVVEDNADMGDFIRSSLEPAYRVALALDGAQGLQQALALKPDLVLTDLMMPGMGGDELLRALRAAPALTDLPVVILTAKADTGQRARLLREGADDYLIKPFSVEELHARVETLVVHRRAVSALRHDEASWRALFERATDGIVIADPGGRYLDVNAAACALLGRDRAQIIGHTIAEMGPPFEQVRLGVAGSQAQGGGAHVREWTLQRGDGSLVVVEVSDCMLSDGRWVGFLRDATESRRQRRAARDLTQELERRVVERTALLRRLAGELEAAESRERRQIARDLHDDLGQTLAAVRIRLTRLCADRRADVRTAAREVAALVDEAQRATHSLAAQLAPAVLYELGLVPALERLAEELGAAFGLRIRVDDDGRSKPLSQEARSIVFRAVRELLINVAKHAKVDCAEVQVEQQDDTMLVKVTDAGVGFQPATAPRPGGFGLLSVQERLGFIGGRFEIHSIPGDGTEAWLWVPLSAEMPAA